MEIDYLRADVTGLCGAIGMTCAPGRGRDLTLELAELRDIHQCALLVSLVGDDELKYLRIADLVERAHERGIQVIRFPIADYSTPDSLDGVIALVKQLLGAVRSGGPVVIHCWAGLGRTGLVAACCLVGCGLTPEAAIAAVRRLRPRAVENSDQETCVVEFARVWQ